MVSSFEKKSTSPRASVSHPVTDETLRCYVGYNIKRAYNVLQADLKLALKPLGLRIGTFSALAVIAQNEGIRASQLAECMAVERANLVILTETLETSGWIARRPCPTDGRAQEIFLTPKGKTLYQRARRVVDEHDARMLGDLEPKLAARLNKHLREIEANAKISIARTEGDA